MSKFDKAVRRLLTRPTDFSWQELQTIMGKLGYEMHIGSGSRRKFINKETRHIIILHEPHPGRILKSYALNYIIDELKRQKAI